jgi:hypothetical protein
MCTARTDQLVYASCTLPFETLDVSLHLPPCYKREASWRLMSAAQQQLTDYVLAQ